MTRPHRIAIVSRDFGDVGGAEYFAARLAEGVAADPRFELHVFSSRPYQGHSAIRSHQLPQPWGPRLLQKPLFAWLAGRALTQHPPFDLIHTHEPLPGAHVVTYGTPHEFWIREVRQKSYFGIHDRLIRNLERKMFAHPHCRRILPMSGMVRETLINAYPEYQAKFQILEPGLDTEIFERLDRQAVRQEIRSQQGLPSDHPVALFIGNNYEHKGLDHLMRAMAQIPADSAAGRLRLWVIGRGPISRYQSIAQTLGIEHRITFLGLIRSGMEKWLAAADFLVLWSAFETFGMVVPEAMAAGLPVLISDRVGAKDLVVPGKNGWIVPYASRPEIKTQALIQACQSLAAEDFSFFTRQTAKQYSWDRARRKILEIYSECLSNSPCDDQS